MVVPAAGGDGETVWAERYVVDLLLVAEEPGEGFGAGGGAPEVHCEVVGGGDEAFSDLAVDGCGCLESGEGFGNFAFLGLGNFAGVVVVGGSEDEVCGEGEVVDPVCVRGEGMC